MSSLFIGYVNELVVVFELVWEIQPFCELRKERAAANGVIHKRAGFPLYMALLEYEVSSAYTGDTA